jgi:hypothetical protein
MAWSGHGRSRAFAGARPLGADVRAGKRARAAAKGGYARVTVSLPPDAMRKFKIFIETQKGMTMSAFVTEAGEAYLVALATGRISGER